MEKYTIIEDYSYVKPGRAYICFYKPIVELGLSVRSFNALVRAGKRFYEDIRSMTYEDICKIPHIGRIHAEEILITMRLYEAGYDIEKIGKRHDETEASTPLQEPDKESYMEKLDKLIGLDKVKEQVRKIAAYAKMNKDLCEKGKEKSFVSMNEKAKKRSCLCADQPYLNLKPATEDSAGTLWRALYLIMQDVITETVKIQGKRTLCLGQRIFLFRSVSLKKGRTAGSGLVCNREFKSRRSEC